VLRLTLRGLHHALDHGVPVRSLLRFAALRHLPRDYTRTQRALSGIIRRWNAGIFQGPQEVPSLVVLEEALAKPLVRLALQWGAIDLLGLTTDDLEEIFLGHLSAHGQHGNGKRARPEAGHPRDR